MVGMRMRVPGVTAVPVHAPDGSVWDVGVEWLPRTPRLRRWWRRRVRGRDVVDSMDLLDTPGDDIVSSVLFAIGAFVVLVLLALFVVPALLLVVDVVVLVLAALLGVLVRVLLGRPWRVVARCTSGPSAGEQQVVEVAGVRRARRAREDLRAAIAATASRAA
ncbi:MAG: hypothetical protein HY830_09770 [Actinobacteria bacterium]|nr:hypothetical protein [Actinomycetota bacterium]